jgi:hypothetical protein
MFKGRAAKLGPAGKSWYLCLYNSQADNGFSFLNGNLKKNSAKFKFQCPRINLVRTTLWIHLRIVCNQSQFLVSMHVTSFGNRVMIRSHWVG